MDRAKCSEARDCARSPQVLAHDQAAARTMLGTPYYMSPEICKVHGPSIPASPANGPWARAPRPCPRPLRAGARHELREKVQKKGLQGPMLERRARQALSQARSSRAWPKLSKVGCGEGESSATCARACACDALDKNPPQLPAGRYIWLIDEIRHRRAAHTAQQPMCGRSGAYCTSCARSGARLMAATWAPSPCAS